MSLADTLTKLDDFLLDRVFQPLTDRLGDRPSAFDIGISLELGAVVLEVAADAALFAVGRLTVGAGLWDGFSCACGMWFYVFMVRQRSLVRPGHANPLRLMYRSLRLLALGFALWSVFAAITAEPLGVLSYALNAVSNLVFVAGMYLISCQPRPPGWRAAERARQNSPWTAPSYT
jgi:hypothetical protein